MSVILVGDRLETLANTLSRLREQTIRGDLELVFAVPDAGTVDPEAADLAAFHSVRVVPVGEIRSMAHARSAGVREASADVVVLTESHSYPHPGWAETLVAAHREPSYAVVGPAIGNANPGTGASWSNLLIDYGRWVEPEGGVVDDVPGHNSAYKRVPLLEYGTRLAEMMESPSTLHADLRDRGHRLYLEPAARTDHLNATRLGSYMHELYLIGRSFGSGRADRWSLPRRLAYALASPLIPVVRFVRISRDVRRLRLWSAVPALFLGLPAHAAGEAVGYVRGRAPYGDAAMLPYELHKEEHLLARP